MFIHSPCSDQILILAKLQLLSQRLSNIFVVFGGGVGGEEKMADLKIGIIQSNKCCLSHF